MALWNLIYMRIWVGFATRLPLIACVISEWASQERGGYHGEAGLGEHARPLWLFSVELSLDSSIGATGRAWQWPALQWYVLGQWLLRFQLDSFDRATWRIQWQKNLLLFIHYLWCVLWCIQRVLRCEWTGSVFLSRCSWKNWQNYYNVAYQYQCNRRSFRSKWNSKKKWRKAHY